MKTIKIILTAIVACTFTFSATAQCHMDGMDDSKKDTKSTVVAKLPANAQTATIKVSGNCESCKARIEKAAKTAGAIKADWNAKAQTLTVAFDPAKTNVDKISKAIAAVGHDTDKYKADDKTYNALPGCCKYERKNK